MTRLRRSLATVTRWGVIVVFVGLWVLWAVGGMLVLVPTGAGTTSVALTHGLATGLPKDGSRVVVSDPLHPSDLSVREVVEVERVADGALVRVADGTGAVEPRPVPLRRIVAAIHGEVPVPTVLRRAGSPLVVVALAGLPCVALGASVIRGTLARRRTRLDRRAPVVRLRRRPPAAELAPRRVGWVVVVGLAGALVAVALLPPAVDRVRAQDPRMQEVMTGSMEPAIPVGSYVALTRVDLADVEIGDVVAFEDPVRPARTVLHRVTAEVVVDGRPALVTKGDANPARDPGAVTADRLRGRVVGVVVNGVPSLRHPTLDAAVLATSILMLGSMSASRSSRPAARRATSSGRAAFGS